jgi:hypothetical protein
MIGRPPFPLPPPGNMSGAPQDNIPPRDVFPKDPRSHILTGGPPVHLPPPGNVSGVPKIMFHQWNILPSVPTDPRSYFMRRGPPFLLPLPGILDVASYDSFSSENVFPKCPRSQFVRKSLLFLHLLQETCLEYLEIIFHQGTSLAHCILHSQREMYIH